MFSNIAKFLFGSFVLSCTFRLNVHRVCLRLAFCTDYASARFAETFLENVLKAAIFYVEKV